jgi:hypothetical protein
MAIQSTNTFTGAAGSLVAVTNDSGQSYVNRTRAGYLSGSGTSYGANNTGGTATVNAVETSVVATPTSADYQCRFILHPMTVGGRAGVWLRRNSSVSGSGYMHRYNLAAIQTLRWDSAVAVELASHPVTLTAGVPSEEFTSRISGSTISLLDGTGTEVESVTDSTYSAAGEFGFYWHGDGSNMTATARMHLTSVIYEDIPSSGVSVNVAHLASGSALYALTLTPGTVNLTVPNLASSATLTAPTFTAGNVNLTVPHLASAAQLSDPLFSSADSMSIPHLGSSATLTAPTFTTGGVSISVPHLASSATLTAPTMTATASLTVPHLASSATLAAPTFTVGNVNLTIPHLANSSTLYAPSLAPITYLEVATGKQLNARFGGSAYTNAWLYVSDDGTTFTHTYAAPQWGSIAHGKLINFRAVQAAYEHEGGTGYPAAFDPQANTDAFIAALPDYADAGVLGVTVGLQGGNPNYGNNGSDYEISAFDSSGNLKVGSGSYTAPQSGTWAYRIKQNLEATRNTGMICILNLFYHGQDQRLTDNNAVRAACDNVVDFLVANDYRHVMIDVANEYDIGGSSPLGWQRTVLSTNSNAVITGSSDQLAGLFIRIRERYTVTHSLDWYAPVGSSTSLTSEFKDNLKKYCDVCFPHGNGHDDWNGDDTYAAMVALRASIDGGVNPNIPIVMNEDANKQSTTNGYVNDVNKAAEMHALNDCLDADVSWGFMLEWIHQKYDMGLDTGWWNWSVGTAGVTQASRTEPDYTADVLAGVQTALASNDLIIPHLASASQLYAPSFTPGGISASIPHLASGTTLYAPTIGAGNVSLTVPHLAPTSTLFAPTFDPGGVALSIDHLASAAVLFDLALFSPNETMLVPHLASSSTLFDLTITSGGVALTVPHLASVATLSAPTIAAGGVNLSIEHLASTSLLYAPSLTASASLTVPHLASLATLFAPTFTAGTVAISLTHLGSSATLYAVSLSLTAPPSELIPPFGEGRVRFRRRGSGLVPSRPRG